MGKKKLNIIISHVKKWFIRLRWIAQLKYGNTESRGKTAERLGQIGEPWVVEPYVDTYNLHQVNCFLTYALEYIGGKHLKNRVEVHIYGNPRDLNRNLYNALQNTCKRVEVHDKNERNNTQGDV